VGGFVCIERSSAGGSADHWLALRTDPFEPEHPAHVALLYEYAADDEEWRSLFRAQSERLVAASGGAIPILESGADRNRPWYATPFVHGVDLRQLTHIVREAEGRLDASVAAAIVLQLSRAIARLPRRSPDDERRWVFRPSDVTLSWDGAIYLLGGGSEYHGRSGGLMPPIEWLSPEQVMGRPTDDRSDVFFLAAFLHFLIVGRSFAKAEHALRNLERIRDGDLDRLADLRPDLPAKLTDTVEDFARHAPSDRPNLDDAVARLASLHHHLGGPDEAGLAHLVRQLAPLRYREHMSRQAQWAALTPESWREALGIPDETSDGGAG
jgi:serine/threonine-protein kinase